MGKVKKIESLSDHRANKIWETMEEVLPDFVELATSKLEPFIKKHKVSRAEAWCLVMDVIAEAATMDLIEAQALDEMTDQQENESIVNACLNIERIACILANGLKEKTNFFSDEYKISDEDLQRIYKVI